MDNFDNLVKNLYEQLDGKAKGVSIEDIAKKHSVPLEQIQKELEMGIKVEMEHTKDTAIARKIALDHLVELPDCYSRLKKMETQAGIKEQTVGDAFGSYAGIPESPIGATGGNIGNTDISFKGRADLAKTLLPMLRRTFPENMMNSNRRKKKSTALKGKKSSKK